LSVRTRRTADADADGQPAVVTIDVPARPLDRGAKMGSYLAFELKELQLDRSRSYAEFRWLPGSSVGIKDLHVRLVLASPDTRAE
jgi:hypothetical protein